MFNNYSIYSLAENMQNTEPKHSFTNTAWWLLSHFGLNWSVIVIRWPTLSNGVERRKGLKDSFKTLIRFSYEGSKSLVSDLNTVEKDSLMKEILSKYLKNHVVRVEEYRLKWTELDLIKSAALQWLCLITSECNHTHLSFHMYPVHLLKPSLSEPKGIYRPQYENNLTRSQFIIDNLVILLLALFSWCWWNLLGCLGMRFRSLSGSSKCLPDTVPRRDRNL